MYENYITYIYTALPLALRRKLCLYYSSSKNCVHAIYVAMWGTEFLWRYKANCPLYTATCG